MRNLNELGIARRLLIRKALAACNQLFQQVPRRMIGIDSKIFINARQLQQYRFQILHHTLHFRH